MKYQEIINLLKITTEQPSKFKTKKLVELKNVESRRDYNLDCQIKFTTKMFKSSLCDYSDDYILVKDRITIVGHEGGDGTTAEKAVRPLAFRKRRNVIPKYCALFTN